MSLEEIVVACSWDEMEVRSTACGECREGLALAGMWVDGELLVVRGLRRVVPIRRPWLRGAPGVSWVGR